MRKQLKREAADYICAVTLTPQVNMRRLLLKIPRVKFHDGATSLGDAEGMLQRVKIRNEGHGDVKRIVFLTLCKGTLPVHTPRACTCAREVSGTDTYTSAGSVVALPEKGTSELSTQKSILHHVAWMRSNGNPTLTVKNCEMTTHTTRSTQCCPAFLDTVPEEQEE
eukprot:3736118-Rhodomonas_salina.4